MITKFKLFEAAKPSIDENTIRIENKEREWYIDLYFESSNVGDKLIYIDNKWDIKIQDYYLSSFSNPLIFFKNWAKKYDNRSEVYYLLQNDIDKYNL